VRALAVFLNEIFETASKVFTNEWQESVL